MRFRSLTAVAMLLMAPPVWAEVVINRAVLSPGDLLELKTLLGHAPAPGRYWYDPLLGAWGREGEGTAGFVAPHLPIVAPLPADISTTEDQGVSVNGRRLHRDEIAWLTRCTAVAPGRYWLRQDGWGGVEGDPSARFNLRRICGGQPSAPRGTLFSYGSLVADADGFGFVDSDGRSATGGW